MLRSLSTILVAVFVIILLLVFLGYYCYFYIGTIHYAPSAPKQGRSCVAQFKRSVVGGGVSLSLGVGGGCTMFFSQFLSAGGAGGWVIFIFEIGTMWQQPRVMSL